MGYLLKSIPENNFSYIFVYLYILHIFYIKEDFILHA